MNTDNFPGTNNGNQNTNDNANSIFNIGGIKIPAGNTLAIWFLVVTVMAIAFLGYGFWHVINRILDDRLGPRDRDEVQIVQKDYNNLLRKYDSLEQANKLLIDSINSYEHKVVKEADSIIYNRTIPYVKEIYKNKKP